MKLASISTGLAALVLAGCNHSDGGNQSTANTMSAEATTDATNAIAENATVASDAANATVDNATAVASAQAVTYSCKPPMAVSVRYDNDAKPDGQAIVTLDGKEYKLDHVQSGSGARYLTNAGRTAGATLVWWNKGKDGTLMEGSVAKPDAEEKTIATCSEKS